jgi:hypothetical protein
MSNWYPKQEAALLAWHANFAAQALLHAPEFPDVLTMDVLTQIGANRDAVSACVNAAEAAKAYGQEVTAFKEIVLRAELGEPVPAAPTRPPAVALPAGALAGVEAYTRRLAAQIKAAEAYTRAIGESLGIVGPEPAPPGAPAVTAVALPQSRVRLDLRKAGHPALAVDSRRGGGPWEQIAVALTSPYVDARAPLAAGQPETREYRVQGMEHNERVGPLSQTATVVTTP